MAEVNRGARRYVSPLRREAAARTRLAVLDAARELFTAQGYMATTVDEIAGRAGVSKPTVFAAAGSKQAILKQLRDIALAGDDEPVPVAQRPWYQEALAEPDPRRAFACTRATPRPSTAGPPTCTKYSGQPRHRIRTCTTCGAPARTNGAAARRSSSTPSSEEPSQGGPGPRRRHRHRVDPHRQRHLLAARPHPAMGRCPVRELARRHAVRTAPAASRPAVRVVTRRLAPRIDPARFATGPGCPRVLPAWRSGKGTISHGAADAGRKALSGGVGWAQQLRLGLPAVAA